MTNCTTRRNCINCIMAGYCHHRKSKAVSNDELANPAFVADILEFCNRMKLKPAEWRKRLYDLYADYNGLIIDRSGNEAPQNMELFEVPDEAFAGTQEELSRANDNIRDWFEYWLCTSHPEQKKYQFRGNTREKLCVVGSIIRATYPHEAQFWGLKGKAANDNAIQ